MFFSFFSWKLLAVPAVLLVFAGVYFYGVRVGSLESALKQSEATRVQEFETNLKLSVKSEEIRQLELKNLDLSVQLENFLQQDTEFLDQVCFTPELSLELNRILEPY